MKNLLLIPLLFLFLYLIGFPVQSISSARDGLSLWYQSVVPTLFPFMFLCRLMINFNLILYLPRFLTKPICFLLGCSHEGALSVIVGFLCGFPTGACFASDLYHTGKISEAETQFLIPFVNNLSPGFLASYLAVEQLKHSGLRLPVLCITLGSSFLYGVITSILRNLKKKHHKTNDYRACQLSKNPPSDIKVNHPDNLFALLDDAISVSVTNTLKLGGYIVFFSVLSDAASHLPVTNPFLLLSASSIEVTKGLNLICTSSFTFRMKQILAIALASFGGWSAAFQTAGVTQMHTRQFLGYIKSRVMITLLSILLSFVFLY